MPPDPSDHLRRQQRIVAVLFLIFSCSALLLLALLVALWLAGNQPAKRLADEIGPALIPLILAALALILLSASITITFIFNSPDQLFPSMHAKPLRADYPGLSLRDAGASLLFPSTHAELSSTALRALRRAFRISAFVTFILSPTLLRALLPTYLRDAAFLLAIPIPLALFALDLRLTLIDHRRRVAPSASPD